MVGRNSLLTQIDKVLSVATRIPVSELRVGVSRNHRREGFAPPQRVLLALCRRLPGCRLRKTSSLLIRPAIGKRHLLTLNAPWPVFLKEHGPVLERQRLEDLCTARGLKRDTFYIHLTYSPVIERFAQGVYGLRGSPVPPGLAESMATRRSKSKLIRITAGKLMEELKSATSCPSRCYRTVSSASLPGPPIRSGALRSQDCRDAVEVGN